MPLLLKDIDKIFKINMSRPVKKRKGNTGFFLSNGSVIPFVA